MRAGIGHFPGLAALLFLQLQAFPVALEGKALTPEGSPVEGATVWISQDRTPVKTTSDSSGLFRMEGLAPAYTEVLATKPGLAMGGATGPLLEDTSFEVYLGAPDVINLRILDDALRPLPGAVVKAMAVSDAFVVRAEDLLPLGFEQPRSDDAGRISLKGLPEGGFVKLVVGHFRYADSNVAYLPVKAEEQEVILTKGLPFQGRITADKQGVEGALISLVKVGEGGRQDFAEARTDPDGMFSAQAPPGSYLAVVRHPGYALPEPQSVLLAEDATEVPLDFYLSPLRRIEGKVLAPPKTPFPGVEVVYRLDNLVLDTAYTDAKGAFSVRVGNFDATLTVKAPEGYMTEALPDVPVRAGQKAKISLPPVRLQRLPEIAGRLWEEEEVPASNVVVRSLDNELPLWAIPDAEGKFQIRLSEVPETTTLTLRAEHVLRFLRRDFEVNLRKLKPLDGVLESFSPDLGDRELLPGANDLSSLVGQPAPEIECSDWFGSPPLSLQSLRGKTVVLLFWAGFDDSAAGLSQINEMKALAIAYGGVPDVVLAAIHDASSTADEVEDFVQRQEINIPVGRDADPLVTFDRYGINVIPQVVIIDQSGILRYFQTTGRLLELIKAVRRGG